MRLLLDECVPFRLRRVLLARHVSTLVLEGWFGVNNGMRIALVTTKFDAFETVDKNLPNQQDTATLLLAVLVVAHFPLNYLALNQVTVLICARRHTKSAHWA